MTNTVRNDGRMEVVFTVACGALGLDVLGDSFGDDMRWRLILIIPLFSIASLTVGVLDRIGTNGATEAVYYLVRDIEQVIKRSLTRHQ